MQVADLKKPPFAPNLYRKQKAADAFTSTALYNPLPRKRIYFLVFFKNAGIWISFSGTLLTGFAGFLIPLKVLVVFCTGTEFCIGMEFCTGVGVTCGLAVKLCAVGLAVGADVV